MKPFIEVKSELTQEDKEMIRDYVIEYKALFGQYPKHTLLKVDGQFKLIPVELKKFLIKEESST